MSKKRENKKQMVKENKMQRVCFLDTDAYEPISVSSKPVYDEIKWIAIVGFIGLCGALAIIFGLIDNSHMDYSGASIVTKLTMYTAVCCAVIAFFRERKNIAFAIIAAYLLLRIYGNWEFLKKGMVRLADNIASQIDNNYSGVDVFGKEASRAGLASDAIVIVGMLWIFIFLFINRKKIEIGISYLFMLPFIIGILIISVYLSIHFLVLLGIYLIILMISGNGNDGRKSVAKKVSFNTVMCGVPSLLIIVLLANLLTPKFLFNEEKVLAIKRDINHKIEQIARVRLNHAANSNNFTDFDLLDRFNGGNIAFNSDPKLGNVSGLKLTLNAELKININHDDNRLFGDRLYLKGKAYSLYEKNAWNSYFDIFNDIEGEQNNETYSLYYPKYFDSLGKKMPDISKDYCKGTLLVKDLFNRDSHFYPYYTMLDRDTSINYEDFSYDCLGVSPYGVTVFDSTSEYTHRFASLPSQIELYKYNDYIKENMKDDISSLSNTKLASMAQDGFDSEDNSETTYDNEAVDAYIYLQNISLPIQEEMPLFYDEFRNMNVEVDGETYDLNNRGYDSKLGIEPYVDYVLKYLEKYKYDLNPGRTPNGMDSVDYFIKNKKGYCMYFATTATLMFRKMGIAARYVEGYAVDIPGKYKNGEELTVRNNDSHAWTEIFIPNMGWIPIEATVGSGSGYLERETKPNQETTKESKTEKKTTKKNQETTTKKNSKQTTQKITQKDNEDTKKVGLDSVIRVIVMILTALVIIIPIIIGLRYLLKYLLKKYYYSFAYFTIDRYEVDLIKLCKIKKINITENYDRKKSISRLTREFGVDVETVKNVYALIDRAKYSKSAEISSAERKTLYKLINKISNKIRQEGNLITKIRVFVLMLRYR